MHETQPTPPPADPSATTARPGGPADPPAPRRPLWKRKLVTVPLGVVAGLLVLLLFTPTIVSTTPVRNFVLSKVNANLNGRVTIEDWSVSWSNGLAVRGVQVYDDQNRQVLQLDSATTQLSLLKAIRGDLALGDTTVNGLVANVVIFPDGSVNLAKLAKPSDKPDEPAGDLPRVSGRFKLVNARATIDRQLPDGSTQTVQLTNIGGDVAVTDIDAPITNSLTVTASVNRGPAGTVTLGGTAGVVQNRRVNVDAANVDQTLTIAGLDGGAVAAFLPPDVVSKLGGTFAGTVKVKVVDGKTVTADLAVDGTNVAVATPHFQGGEAYVTPTLALRLAPTTLSLPQGLSKFDAGHLKTAGEGLTFRTAHLSLAVAGDAPVSALLAVAQNRAPGAAGTLTESVEVVDVPGLARMLPQTLGIRPDVKVDSGAIVQKLTLAMTPDRATPTASVRIAGVRGTVTAAGENGAPPTTRPIAVQDVVLDLSGVAHGGGWKAPDLRDVKLTLESGFGGGAVTAPTLATTSGKFDFDLAKVRQQVGQFSAALDAYALAGTLTVEARSTADPAKPTEPSTLDIVATVRDLNVGGLAKGRPLVQPLVRVALAAGVSRDKVGNVDRLTGVKLSALAGTDAARTVDLALSADEVKFAKAADGKNRFDVPKFTIDRGAVDLARVRKDYGRFVPSLAEIEVASGAAAVTGGGSYVNDVAAFDATVALNDVTTYRVLGVGRLGKRMEMLKAYALTANVAGTYGPAAAGGTTARLTKLDVADNQNTVRVRLATKDLLVSLPAQGVPTGVGSLSFAADVGRLKDIYKIYHSTPTAVAAYYIDGGMKKPRLKSVALQGTLALTQAAAGLTTAALDADFSNLNMTSLGQPLLTNEAGKVALTATVAGDLTVAKLERLLVQSTVVSVTGTADARLMSGPGKDAVTASPLAMLRAGTFTVTAPDLGRVQALLDAFLKAEEPAVVPVALGPPVPLPEMYAQAAGRLPPGTVVPPPPAAPATQPAPAPPAKLAGGSAVVTLTVAGDGATLTTTPDVQAKAVVLGVGDVRYPIGDATLRTTAQIASATRAPVSPKPDTRPAAAPATEPSLLEEIREVRVTQLAATALGATVGLKDATTPIVITGVADLPALMASVVPSTQPSTKPAPTGAASVSGTVVASGQLEPLLKLQAVLGGKPAVAEYAGAFAVEQRLAVQNGRVKLLGSGTVADFAARDPQGRPTFTEKSVRLANSLSLVSAGGKATAEVEQLTLAAETSKAFSVEVKGSVVDLSGKRAFDRFTVALTYDAEPLWQIIRPMLSEPGTPPDQDRYAKYVVKGKGTRAWSVGGSLPAVDESGAAVPFDVAIRTLWANGSIGLDSFEGDGLAVGRTADGKGNPIELPLGLRDGLLWVADLTRPQGQQYPPPIPCNGGEINLGGSYVDLRATPYTLTVPPGTQLLKNVQLNPILSDRLAGTINNPLLVKPDSTKGVLDIKVEELRGFPLGNITKLPAAGGYAKITYSFGGVQLGNQWVQKFAELAKIGDNQFALQSLQGSISEGSVVYNNGIIGHDMTLVLAEQKQRKLRLYGNVRLADGQMLPLTLLFSPEWLGGDVARVLPKGLPVAMTGPYNAPQLNLQTAVSEAVKQNWFSGKPEDVGNLINLFAGGGNKKPDGRKPAGGDAAATQPAAKPRPNDPIGGILGNLLDDAARREQEKKEKERREKERREGDRRDR
ncbi:MAG TPA: hypothetical protein VF796_22245 [Humisphaera sp.]